METTQPATGQFVNMNEHSENDNFSLKLMQAHDPRVSQNEISAFKDSSIELE